MVEVLVMVVVLGLMTWLRAKGRRRLTFELGVHLGKAGRLNDTPRRSQRRGPRCRGRSRRIRALIS